MKPTALLLGAALLWPMSGSAQPADDGLEAAIQGAWRSPAFVKRDPARHPLQELRFFGIRPDMTVVEVWPGGGYWTEMLAPYLRAHGTLIAALSTRPDESDAIQKKLAADPALYGQVKVTALEHGTEEIAPPGSADLVVTFRNLHNWMDKGDAEAVLADLFRALKPGGHLGIEEHRGRPDRPQDVRAASGYVRQDYAVGLAQQAGFVLEASSEIGANPKDTTDWPKGVWTLPPTFRLGDQDRAKYAAIGEADNFVLLFSKPRR